MSEHETARYESMKVRRAGSRSGVLDMFLGLRTYLNSSSVSNFLGFLGQQSQIK